MNTNPKFIGAVALSLALASCAYGPGVPANSYVPPVFPDALRAKYQAYDQPGTGSISGQAFLRTRSGDVKHAAGELVTAEPATDEAVRVAQATDRRPPWKEIESYRRSTTADAEGRFRFDNLPPGRWLLMSQVYWEVPTGSRYAPTERTGGVAMAVIDLAEGERKEGAVVTR